MLEAGALEEAARFEALAIDPALPANKALGLDSLRRHRRGEISRDAAALAAQRATRNYAKRQTTWFRHQLPPLGSNGHSHASHARFTEFSERNMDEIISFILRND
jgi:tRNA dimethylallyltransferase